MKALFSTLLVGIFFTACSSPEERAQADAARARRDAVERQANLQEEARENFQRERERELERREDIEEARREAAEDAADRAREVQKKRQEAAEDAARYRAYEAEYARQLGKKPSQLTPSERAWIRENFD